MRWLLLLCIACAPPELPPPSRVETPVGTVRVVPAPGPLVIEGDTVLGAWLWDQQRIVIDTATSPRTVWHTYYHELCHVALDAAGVSNMVTGEKQEAVCDAIATARLRERFR